MAKLTKQTFIESLKEMNIKEVMELVDAMKEEFGIDPTAATVVASSLDAQADAAPTEVSVILKSAGGNKVAVIKIVKELTGLGLMEAKALVDGVPKPIKEKIKPEEAKEIATQLTTAGAEVEVK